MDRRTELRKYRRMMTMAGAGALVVTFGSLAWFIRVFPPLVAYFACSAVALPFLVVMWRLESRYADLLFRDDLD